MTREEVLYALNNIYEELERKMVAAGNVGDRYRLDTLYDNMFDLIDYYFDNEEENEEEK